MKVFTKFELQQMPAYEFMSRILSEAELQFYYNTPPEQRATKLSELVLVRQERGRIIHTPTDEPTIFTPEPKPTIFTPEPKPTREIDRTQKCTDKRDLMNRVDRAVKLYMNKVFIYKNKVYNMTALGYRFHWNNDRNRFGYQHKSYRRKIISLSRWMLQYSDGDYDFWVDTILHEIAHAIDMEIRGNSDHSWKWRQVALAIGCNGNRCGEAKVDPHVAKYTIVCPNGHKSAGHKWSSAIAEGRKSCGQCNPNFDKRYIVKQIQNY